MEKNNQRLVDFQYDEDGSGDEIVLKRKPNQPSMANKHSSRVKLSREQVGSQKSQKNNGKKYEIQESKGSYFNNQHLASLPQNIVKHPQTHTIIPSINGVNQQSLIQQLSGIRQPSEDVFKTKNNILSHHNNNTIIDKPIIIEEISDDEAVEVAFIDKKVQILPKKYQEKQESTQEANTDNAKIKKESSFSCNTQLIDLTQGNSSFRQQFPIDLTKKKTNPDQAGDFLKSRQLEFGKVIDEEELTRRNEALIKRVDITSKIEAVKQISCVSDLLFFLRIKHMNRLLSHVVYQQYVTLRLSPSFNWIEPEEITYSERFVNYFHRPKKSIEAPSYSKIFQCPERDPRMGSKISS